MATSANPPKHFHSKTETMNMGSTSRLRFTSQRERRRLHVFKRANRDTTLGA